MPGYFKKRRTRSGPNKNEEKILRARSEEDRARLMGTVSSRFPTVQNLRIHVVFLDPRQQPLDEKTLNLKPSDAAAFAIPCPGRCGRGSFDLSAMVAETIGGQRPLSERGIKCPETLYADSPELCGWEARCRVEVEYQTA